MKYKAVDLHELPEGVDLMQTASGLLEQQQPDQIQLVLLLYCARCADEHEPFECQRQLPL